MADELIDIYDGKNNPLGVRKMKSEAHREGLWHRAAHVWMHNDRGEILLQLRAGEKEQYPKMWDISAAGHIGAGEEPLAAALRETEEEVGLSLVARDLDFFQVVRISEVYKEIHNNSFEYVYFCRFNGKVEDMVLQKEEVEKVRFFSGAEIEAGLAESPEEYVPHGAYWLDVIAEVGRRSGML